MISASKLCGDAGTRARGPLPTLGFMLIAATLGIAGCAATSPQDEALLGPWRVGVSGDRTHVKILTPEPEIDPVPIAREYCAQYGRMERFREASQYRVIFDCVEPAR